MKWITLDQPEYEPPSLCHFGLTELPALIAGGLGALGVGGELVGTAAAPGLLATGLSGALEGSAFGALSSGLTGGNPLTGALTGGVTGGAIGGFGPLVGSALGIGTTAGDILTGIGTGAATQAATGGNPLIGAATGGVGGAVAGLTGGAGSTAPTATGTTAGAVGTGAGASPAATTAGITPAASTAGGGASVDLTSVAPVGSDFGGGGTTAPFGSDLFTPSQISSAWGTLPAPATATSGLSNIGNSVLSFAQKNPGVLLGAGVLGADLLLGNKPPAAQGQLQAMADQNQANAKALQSYEITGTLPPGLQAVVDQQVEAAKGQVVQQFTSLGLGDSTMLADKLNQLKAQKTAEMAQLAGTLAQQGIQLAGLSSNEIMALLKAQTQQQDQFTAALGTFASGLAGLKTGTGTTSA